jgi:hypothetical protein
MSDITEDACHRFQITYNILIRLGGGGRGRDRTVFNLQLSNIFQSLPVSKLVHFL